MIASFIWLLWIIYLLSFFFSSSFAYRVHFSYFLRFASVYFLSISSQSFTVLSLISVFCSLSSLKSDSSQFKAVISWFFCYKWNLSYSFCSLNFCNSFLKNPISFYLLLMTRSASYYSEFIFLLTPSAYSPYYFWSSFSLFWIIFSHYSALNSLESSFSSAMCEDLREDMDSFAMADDFTE